MDKRLVFPRNNEKERDLFLVQEDRNYLLKQARASAYHPKVAAYIEKAKPLPNLVQVLLTALGAFPFWPQNVNGDRFLEKPLKHEGEDYGYKTFETNANYFTHHVNKDPALAKGKVLHSVWNDKAKRVELVIGIDVNKDPDAASSIDNGESLCFSMGCKVPYDVCSICANKAKTREQYCEHLRYLMNQIDISRVLIPADKTAYMWQKVASAGNPFTKLSSAHLADLPPGKLNDMKYLMDKVAEQEEHRKIGASKNASVKKNAAITKQVPVVATPNPAQYERVLPAVKAAKTALQNDEPALPPETMSKLRAAAPKIEELLSTVFLMGIQPHPEELKAFGVTPESAKSLKLNPSHFNDEAAKALQPHLADRSYARPYLVRRIVLKANNLDKNQHLAKHAGILGKSYKSQGVPTQPSPGLVAGVAAALYALLGQKFVVDHPIFSLALGVTGLATLNTFRGTRDSGFIDVDRNSTSSYNKGWQRSLAYSQEHPVSVIKTGASESGLVKKAFYGLPMLFLTSDFLKESNDQSTGSLPPELLNAGALANDAQGIHTLVKNALESGERLFKEPSLHNLDFLSAVPDEHQSLFWDLAIMGAANRIHKKLGG
jgi:hypothetical protein